MFIICPGREVPTRYLFVFMVQKAFLEYLYFNILMNIFSRDMKFWKGQKFWNVPSRDRGIGDVNSGTDSDGGRKGFRIFKKSFCLSSDESLGRIKRIEMFLKPNDHFDHKSMIALPSGLQKWVDIIIAYAKEKMQIKTEKAEDQLRLRKGFIFMLRRLANRRRPSEDP